MKLKEKVVRHTRRPSALLLQPVYSGYFYDLQYLVSVLSLYSFGCRSLVICGSLLL
jgi:hypothetical protein